MLRVMSASLGEIIRRERDRRGWLARELAAKLEIDPGTLSRLENGNYKDTPSPDLLRRISVTLEVPERVLLESLGYAIADGGPSYNFDLFPMIDEVQKWTPKQRELLRRYIEAVSSVMDEFDPPPAEDGNGDQSKTG